ncbi:MAG TPA: recombinase family protein, partial [Candidatus Babeliaceae bacterium]|nr:recombinase family protein [Candidatus Babeliaceae bacterium]
MKLILIARVSDVEQRKALPAQKLRLKQYAAAKDPKAEYHEFDESAHKDNRQKFAKLVEHIKLQRELVVVVFDKIDRYTRDSSQEEVRALNALVKIGRIELHFPSDNLFITKDSPAADLFRLGIGVALAKYYSDSIRDNVARRYQQMLHDKTWVGRAPIGYLNIDRGTNSKPVKDIVIDPLRAPHVVTIFEKRSTGMTYAAIAELVNEAGLVSKSGKAISKSNVEQITRNPFYCGTMLYMGKAYPHKYETLITRELYDKCQLIRDQRRENRSAYRTIPFVFNGFVRCQECKCMISSYISRNSTYLKCSKAKYKTCRNVNTPQVLVMPQIEELLASIPLSDENLEMLVRSVKDNHGNHQQYLDKAVQETRKEYDKITSQLKALTYERLDAIKTGKGIGTELFDEIVEELTGKQQALNQKLIRLTNYNKDYLVTASHLLDLGQRCNQLFHSSDNALKQKLLRFLVYNVYLYDQKLSYKLNDPYREFIQLNKKP